MDKIIVYSIKKAGTHMISDIISLLYDINCDIYKKEEMYKIVPHIRYLVDLKNSKQDCISTHPCYFNMKSKIINDSNNAIIFVIRDPLDLCISQYYFYEKRKKISEQKTLLQYCKNNYKEQLRLVNRHIQKQKKVKNSILISFEDVVSNKKNTIIKIYEFLKLNNKLQDIELDENIINIIIEKTTFNQVKNNEIKNGKYIVGNKQPELFHRKGTIDQWKDHFTEEEYDSILYPNSKSTQTDF